MSDPCFYNIYRISGRKKKNHIAAQNRLNLDGKHVGSFSLAIQFSYRSLTTSSLPGADGLDGVCWLPRIQEGDVGLRAHSVHRPVLPICQAHILFAVRQLSGQKLEKDNVTGIIFARNSWEMIVV